MSTPFEMTEEAKKKWALLDYLKKSMVLRSMKCRHCDWKDRLKVSLCQNLPGWVILLCRVCGNYQKVREAEGGHRGLEIEKHVELYPGEGR